MLRFFVSAGLLAGLSGCAAAPQPAMRPPTAAAPPAVSAERGTILAVRPVPARDPQPLRLLLQQTGGDIAESGTQEFIVRSDGGDTLAIVQAGTSGLRAGERVAIMRGVPTPLSPLPIRTVVH